MPQLYSTNGADRKPRWIGRTLVVNDGSAEVRRRYQREDTLLLADAAPSAGASRPSVLTRARRLVGLSSAPVVPRRGSE
jgi:hypothetical protein